MPNTKIPGYVYLKPSVIAAQITDIWSNSQPYVGEVLFPQQKKLGLDLEMIKGSKGAPVALKPAAFDSKVTYRERIGFEALSARMPYFKEAYRLSENNRQQLLMMQEAADNNPALQSMISLVYDDINNLLEGARTVSERMRMQMLATGKISITENEQQLEYDFRVPADNFKTLTSTDTWDNVDATIIDDINTWKEDVLNRTGIEPTRAICNSSVWKNILKNNQVKDQFRLFASQQAYVSGDQLKNFFAENLGIEILVYDKVYQAPTYDSNTGRFTGYATSKFFADNTFTLFPSGNLGNTWFGTTPEEADLLGGVTDADVTLVNNAIAVAQYTLKDPVNLETKVSQVCLPSFDAADHVIIATVQ
jgi:hypothetical protein